MIASLEKYKDALTAEPKEHPVVPKLPKKVTIREDTTTDDKVSELRKEVGGIGGVYVTKTWGTEKTSVSALDRNDTTMGVADPTLQLPDAHDSTWMGGFNPKYISTPAKALIADRNKGKVEQLSPVKEEVETTLEKEEGEKVKTKPFLPEYRARLTKLQQEKLLIVSQKDALRGIEKDEENNYFEHERNLMERGLKHREILSVSLTNKVTARIDRDEAQERVYGDQAEKANQSIQQIRK